MIFEYNELFARNWLPFTEPQDGKVLMLCPLLDFKNVPNGTVMMSVRGISCIKGTHRIDDNSKNGYMGYGVEVEISKT